MPLHLQFKQFNLLRNNNIDTIFHHSYPSGNVYQGQWKNGVRHGDGTMKWIQLCQQYSGQWVNGIQVRPAIILLGGPSLLFSICIHPKTWTSSLQHGYGIHTWFLRRVPDSQYPSRNKYKGQFDQGLRHGQGTFYYASGAVYSGSWKHNRKHGQVRSTVYTSNTMKAILCKTT